MSAVGLYGVAAALVVAFSVYALIVSRDLVRKLIALNVMGSAIFLAFVALSARTADVPDPVPHAMVLTGIVVTVAITGFAVTLIRRSVHGRGRANLPEDGVGP